MFLKSLVLPSASFDGVAMCVLSLLFAAKLWLDHIKKPDFNQEILGIIQENREYLEEKFAERFEANHEDIKKVDAKISAIIVNSTQKPKSNTASYGWGQNG
jgi:hypothetical protein